MIKKMSDPLWGRAKPLSESVYELTDSPSFKQNPGFRERVRRIMSSALTCIEDALRDDRHRLACAYLAGAECNMRYIVEDLGKAYEMKYISREQYRQLFEGCAAICRLLNDKFVSMPEVRRKRIPAPDGGRAWPGTVTA